MINSQFLIQKNKHLDKRETIEQLFEFVDKNIDITKYRRYLLQNDTDLTNLASSEYFAQPLHVGDEKLLVIKRFDDNYYSVMMPIKGDSMRIFPSNIKSHKNTYDGTIFQGIFDGKTFWITDVYLLAGINIQSHKIDTKFLNLEEFTTNYFSDSSIKVKLNPLFPLKKINDCIEYAKKAQAHVAGIIFSPQIPFVLQRVVTDGIAENIKQYHHNYFYLFTGKEEVQKAGKITFGNTAEQKTLMMQKTKVADVYKLFDGKKHIGIAYVSNIEYSILYQSWFKQSTELQVDCIWNTQFKKWSPIKLNSN